MLFLSHFSTKPHLLFSSLPSSASSLRPRLPKFPFYPSHFFKSPYSSSLACHVSTAGSGGGAQMESSASVDSVTRDLKNQRLDTESETDGGDESKMLKKLKALEDLNWDHSFVRELPGDPRTDSIPREVSLFYLIKRNLVFFLNCNFLD